MQKILRILMGSIVLIWLVDGALAQQQPQRNQQGQQQSAIPPALRAAILSGNSAQIQQAINTLSGGDPGRAAALALQVVNEAEKMVATNPSGAASVAGAAIAAVSGNNVINSAPQAALSVATIASRIVANPSVSAAAPAMVATVSMATVQVATSPQVYAVSPTAALSVMSSSYTTASLPGVAAASPGALSNITQNLVTASNNSAINAAFVETPAVITAIITKQPHAVIDNVRETIRQPETASPT
ncbi:MAG: hypothetical protein HQL34_03470 [Alphaproteobacteria bacterium]|nr:hypothetical protein [Alphaproteobacteria bacterium]